jgi:diadenosine tetraphosphate (Ap4A) HIT family hydrolase
MDCELCKTEMALFGDENAFVRYDNNSLSKGHVLIIPRRHVADFFEMTWA